MQEAYELALARFYMWAQTDATVFLAVRIPTGTRPLTFLGMSLQPPARIQTTKPSLAFVIDGPQDELQQATQQKYVAARAERSSSSGADCSTKAFKFLMVNNMAPACAGYGDRELMLEVGAGAFKLQAEDSPPVIDRALAYGVDTAQPVTTFRPAQP